MPWKTRRIRTALAGTAAALLYLGAAVWAPLVHAQFEVVLTASAISSEHSESAPVVHDDGLCQMVTAFQFRVHDVPGITTPSTVTTPVGLSSRDRIPARGFEPCRARAPPQ